jgi:hypothetical protein
MRFWDMKKFNQALLARQAMRLIQFPESLCARVLRAKYYLNDELVNTIFPGNSSRMWWSIEHGLELLKHGINWRVGSGAKIQIWRDPWLPRAPSKKISFKQGVLLFVGCHNSWHPNDHVAWFYEKAGIFLVRSAYHLVVNLDSLIETS